MILLLKFCLTAVILIKPSFSWNNVCAIVTSRSYCWRAGPLLLRHPTTTTLIGNPKRNRFVSERYPIVSYPQKLRITCLFGWLDDFLSSFNDNSNTNGKSEIDDPVEQNSRKMEYPEQYVATYELLSKPRKGDTKEVAKVRPLLQQTQLENRSLDLVFDANRQGWRPEAFHQAVDGKGAAIVLAITQDNRWVGGYNPKGWTSLGGARPSVASFLFYSTPGGSTLQKLRKVGGGGLACARDDPTYGIAFGPDALLIGLQPKSERLATSKLGPYFEKGPENLPSLFQGGTCQLKSLQVFVGRYAKNERIPYSGGVLDMTSG